MEAISARRLLFYDFKSQTTVSPEEIIRNTTFIERTSPSGADVPRLASPHGLPEITRHAGGRRTKVYPHTMRGSRQKGLLLPSGPVHGNDKRRNVFPGPLQLLSRASSDARPTHVHRGTPKHRLVPTSSDSAASSKPSTPC